MLNKNYADALESYMIPAEEGLVDKIKNLAYKMDNTDASYKGIFNIISKEARIRNKGIYAPGSNFNSVKEDLDKAVKENKDIDAKEWARKFNLAAFKDAAKIYKMDLARFNTDAMLDYFEKNNLSIYPLNSLKSLGKKNEKKDNIYRLNFNGNKALPDSNIVYPENKFKTRRELIDSMEKDLKIALRKLLSSQEINDAFAALCEEYNRSPRGKEFDDRFRFDGPSKLSVNWLKSQFTVENFEESNDEVIFEISNRDQDFTIWIGMSLVYVLGDYIENMYQNHIGVIRYGDGDEGCIYIQF